MFATTLGEHVFYLLLAMGTLVWLAGKVVTTVDDDGQVKKAASEGFAAWISRWLK